MFEVILKLQYGTIEQRFSDEDEAYGFLFASFSKFDLIELPVLNIGVN